MKSFVRWKMSTIKCKECEGQFKLKELLGTKGKCPSCGAHVPFSDYCAYIPERRWWHLFSAAPISLKFVVVLCSLVCAFFLPSQVLWAVVPLLEGRYDYKGLHLFCGALSLFLVTPFLVPMIWGAVCGRIPYASIVMLVALVGCSYWDGGVRVCIFHFCAAIFFGAFYFTPSAIRWRARCREERCAFSVAVKSGADLTTLEAREYPLNKVAICIYLILVLGVLWISAWNMLRFFYPYSQLWE